MATKVLEDWEVKKICWENDVYVIQTPISSKWKKGGQPVRLTIDYQRTYKKGKEIFEQNSKELEDKIDEVYRYLYENNIK
jgi:spore coat polysaccharide biosynthesis protein SpsF (cytidylyltransferase family)